MNIFTNETREEIDIIKKSDKIIGFTCSCFDLMHAGHCLLLEDAKSKCDILVIGLQTDPTIDRPSKNKPIQSYKEREIILRSKRYVDYIIKYQTEEDLVKILNCLNPNIRFIGSDYIGKKFTGDELPIEIYYHERNHSYSSSSLRKRIWEAENKKFTK